MGTIKGCTSKQMWISDSIKGYFGNTSYWQQASNHSDVNIKCHQWIFCKYIFLITSIKTDVNIEFHQRIFWRRKKTILLITSIKTDVNIGFHQRIFWEKKIVNKHQNRCERCTALKKMGNTYTLSPPMIKTERMSTKLGSVVKKRPF